MEIAEALSRLNTFADVPLIDLRGSSTLWRDTRLESGETLWGQGSATFEMGLLLTGQLGAFVNDTEVGRINPGQLVGEASVFTSRVPRSADVAATMEGRVLLIDAEDLALMRGQFPSVYDALLDQALVQIVRRINATDLEIAKLAPGEVPAPERRDENIIQRFFKQIANPSGGITPIVTPILRSMEGMEDVSDALLTRMSAAFEPKRINKDDPLFLEGERGSTVYVIAEGEIDVLRNVPGRNAMKLVTLGPGSLFGTGCLVLGGGRRAASCVATTPAWVFEMTHDSYRHLKGDEGRIWRESLMGALRHQIMQANALLARFKT